MKKQLLVKAALYVSALFIIGMAPAGATLMTLTLNDGTQTASFTDNGTGIISEGSLFFDDWLFGQITATGPGVIGDASSDLVLNLNWGAISTAGNTSPLTMTLTESGVSGASYQASDVNLSIGGIQILSAPGTVTQMALINSSTVLSQGSFTTNPFSGAATAAVTGGSAPFSFSEQVVILNNPGHMTYIGGNASAEDRAVVPESSYGLGFSVLLLSLFIGKTFRERRAAST